MMLVCIGYAYQIHVDKQLVSGFVVKEQKVKKKNILNRKEKNSFLFCRSPAY